MTNVRTITMSEAISDGFIDRYQLSRFVVSVRAASTRGHVRVGFSIVRNNVSYFMIYSLEQNVEATHRGRTFGELIHYTR